MSPFFGNPAFVAATHDERARRLRQFSRLRRSTITNLEGDHGRGRGDRRRRAR